MPQIGIVDARGLSLSAPGIDAVERFDEIINDLYYYRLGVQDRLDALLEECPNLVLGHVLKGYGQMSDGMLGAHPAARARLELAEALPANRRERLHQEALRAWIAQDYSARSLAWEQILVEWPMDLLALRQYTGTLFWSGDKRHQAEVLAGVVSHWGSQAAGYGHVLSAHAFALEEVGQYKVAEQYAREALALQPQDLWALHALAHVFEMQGRSEEGMDVLGEAKTFLGDYNLFRGHLWWHLSLFYLSNGKFNEVLDLFDREIYPQASGFYLDIQNGVSLLLRLECQGVDVGHERWERLAQASLSSATQCTVWFTAMHHAIALARTGRISAIQTTLEHLESVSESDSQAWLAHELARAAVAYCDGNSRQALEQFLALRQHQGDLGASHAQQDIYYQMMVTAALQIGDTPRVRQLLKARLGMRVQDDATWQVYVNQSRLVDDVDDISTIQAALRWSESVLQ